MCGSLSLIWFLFGAFGFFPRIPIVVHSLVVLLLFFLLLGSFNQRGGSTTFLSFGFTPVQSSIAPVIVCSFITKVRQFVSSGLIRTSLLRVHLALCVFSHLFRSAISAAALAVASRLDGQCSTSFFSPFRGGVVYNIRDNEGKTSFVMMMMTIMMMISIGSLLRSGCS